MTRLIYTATKDIKNEEEKIAYIKELLTIPPTNLKPQTPEAQVQFEKHPVYVIANAPPTLLWLKISVSLNAQEWPFNGPGLWAFFCMCVEEGLITLESVLRGPRHRVKGARGAETGTRTVEGSETEALHVQRKKSFIKHLKYFNSLGLWLPQPTKRTWWVAPNLSKGVPSPYATTVGHTSDYEDSSDDGVEALQLACQTQVNVKVHISIHLYT